MWACACAALQHRADRRVPDERSDGYRAACSERMTVKGYCAIVRRNFRAVAVVLTFSCTNQGRLAVNLALKWDVIAVCAVFVFVGAVLLGAF
jgi:hypothetical protein